MALRKNSTAKNEGVKPAKPTEQADKADTAEETKELEKAADAVQQPTNHGTQQAATTESTQAIEGASGEPVATSGNIATADEENKDAGLDAGADERPLDEGEESEEPPKVSPTPAAPVDDDRPLDEGEESVTDKPLTAEEKTRLAGLQEEKLRAEAEAKAAAEGTKLLKKDTPQLVSVKNLRQTSFRQPSTGFWIGANETKFLLDDGWLANQIRAKLMRKEKPKDD